MFILDNVFLDIKRIINSVVIKYDKEARKYETLEITKEADKYISAVTQQDSFNTYQKFDIEAVFDAGVTSLETAALYAENKSKIPYELRDRIVIKQRERIIKNYVEKNNYYRMLSGLPDLEDLTEIFIDPETCVELNINPNIPVPLLSNEDIIILESKGKIAELQEKYPTKKYLHYLGPNRISIARARTSKNFSILRMTKNDISENLYKEFNEIYEQSREYYMSVIYVKEYGKRYDLYDNFIALMIMVMTIQRVITNIFKYGIERDFYDLNSIEMMFEAYNVPFMRDLPLEYQRTILRNLNNLLRYKSTDKVLYDICSLLGFERIKIFKYFLIKQHKLDENEKPVFIYKEELDEKGQTILVEDKERMYELYFQTVELRERNTALALQNSTNKMDYYQVTSDDPYWLEDDELKQQLLESDFNFVETKYLNMNIMYKLTEMLFEVMYIFRMLLDKKNEIAHITVQLPKLFYDKNIKLFDVMVLMCALIARKNNMKGNILHTPSKILSVMGFDFKEDFALLREEIKKNPYIDPKTLTFLEKLNIQVPEDINNLFVAIRDFNDFLVEKMASSKNIKEYQAYKKLYNTLMVTEETTSIFSKPDGTPIETFKEYLLEYEKDLYNFVESCEQGKISEYIDHIISKIEEMIVDSRYLYIVNDSNNAVLDAIISFTKFFKSYTTDLVSMNIYYVMDSRYYNMVKLINDLNRIEKNILPLEKGLVMSYNDLMKLLSARLTKPEYMKLFNQSLLYSVLQPEELVNFIPKLDVSAHVDIDYKALVLDIPHIFKIITTANYFDMHEKFFMSSKLIQKEFQDFKELQEYTAQMKYRQKFLISLITTHLYKIITSHDIQKLEDSQPVPSAIINEEINITIEQMCEYFKTLGMKTDLDLFYSDSLKFIKQFYQNETIKTLNMINRQTKLTLNSMILNYFEKYVTYFNISVDEKLNMLKQYIHFEKQLTNQIDNFNIRDKWYPPIRVLYPEERIVYENLINEMSKNFKLYMSLLNQYSDVISRIQSTIKGKTTLNIKDRIRLIYEE